MLEKVAAEASNETLAEIVEASCKGYWEDFGAEAAKRLRKLGELEKRIAELESKGV